MEAEGGGIGRRLILCVQKKVFSADEHRKPFNLDRNIFAVEVAVTTAMLEDVTRMKCDCVFGCTIAISCASP
ncbi:MAG TPA: hypothetical protein ACQGQH_03970 [Xylella sp.]